MDHFEKIKWSEKTKAQCWKSNKSVCWVKNRTSWSELWTWFGLKIIGMADQNQDALRSGPVLADRSYPDSNHGRWRHVAQVQLFQNWRLQRWRKNFNKEISVGCGKHCQALIKIAVKGQVVGKRSQYVPYEIERKFECKKLWSRESKYSIHKNCLIEWGEFLIIIESLIVGLSTI